jgi:hypothetical protein
MSVKIVRIDTCRDCPFVVSLGWGEGYQCGLTQEEATAGTPQGEEGEEGARLPAPKVGRALRHKGCVIPSWCPLPSAPEGSMSDRSERIEEVRL